MLLVAHIFVASFFVLMGASFIATTVTLAFEFWDNGWLDFLAFDSHLFVFFPTFGIVALFAFYIPSVAFVDHYWRRIRFGTFRFFAGLLVLVAASWVMSDWILSPDRNKSIWQIKPSVLLQDRGSPAGCLANGDIDCARMPSLLALSNLRDLSSDRLGLQPFIRDCRDDKLLRIIESDRKTAYCPALTPFSRNPKLVDDRTCCRAQEALVSAINRMYEASPANASLTGKVHAALLPLKVFFLLVLLAISTLFLTLRFKAIQRFYRRHMLAIDIGLIVGTIATLFFPLMSQAFVQSLIVLTGSGGRGPFSEMVPYIAVAFLIWALLVIAFFLRRDASQTEKFLKIGSFVGAGIGLLKYDVVVDYVVLLIGSGAAILSVSGLVALTVVFAWGSLQLWKWSIRESEGRNIFTGKVLGPDDDRSYLQPAPVSSPETLPSAVPLATQPMSATLPRDPVQTEPLPTTPGEHARRAHNPPLRDRDS